MAGTVLVTVDAEVDETDPDPEDWKLAGSVSFYWTYWLDHLDVDFLVKHIHDLK